MEINIQNSIKLQDNDNNNSNTSKRHFSNSDLEYDYSYFKKNIYSINEINQEENEIPNDNNDDNSDNSNSNDINNGGNNGDHNPFNFGNLQVNNSNDSISEHSQEKKRDSYTSLIDNLIINNYIFKKDYYGQKIDKNNTLYRSWFIKLYKKIYSKESLNIDESLSDMQKSPKIKYLEIINTKVDFNAMRKSLLEMSLFFCDNPECNAIVYMNNEQKKLFGRIRHHLYDEGFELISGYYKVRCPLCLTYRCIYCKRISTFLNANCCIAQLTYACMNPKNHIYLRHYYCIFKLVIFFPIIRVCYIATMINFQLFRAISLENKLLHNGQKISEIINSQTQSSDKIFGTYQSKFRRISMIIISLLNIIGSICWALPYVFFCEIFLIIIMFLYLFSINDKFLQLMNLFYLLAFAPGLRRNIFGHIKYQEIYN
jgi:hypothetical protein